MKLGFASAILPDLQLPDLLRFAADERFQCVELMSWPAGKADRRYAGVTHLDVEDFDAASARNTLDLLAEANITVSSLGYYPNALSSDAAEADKAQSHLRKVIRAAGLLGIGTVTSFIGRDPKLSVDANWPRFREVWTPLFKLAIDSGVRIAIENCPMLFTADEWPGGKNLATTPAIWRRMFAEFPDAPLGLNFDPSHFVWQQMDYIKPLREFASRIFHVHAKDARVDRDKLDEVGIMATPLQYHTPKLPGLGEVNWGRFFSVLADAGYNGPVCIEVEDRAYEQSLERRKEALRQSRDFLRQFVR